jgi:MFS transporter, DHA2 family, multidrug resistance protein
VGAAMMQAIQKVGAPFGAAILGSVLSSVYQAQLNLVGLPLAVANVVKESLFGGLAVALQLGSAPLLESVRIAFVHGMDVSLVVAAGIAAAGFVLTLAFLPGRAHPKAGEIELVVESPAHAIHADSGPGH